MGAPLQLIIAVLLAYVAYQNYRINSASLIIAREKFRLDLYEGRRNVLRAILDTCVTVTREGTLTHKDIAALYQRTFDGQFLFAGSARRYIRTFQEKSSSLWRTAELVSTLPQGEKRSKAVDEKWELVGWLSDQHINAPHELRRYLRFTVKLQRRSRFARYFKKILSIRQKGTSAS